MSPKKSIIKQRPAGGAARRTERVAAASGQRIRLIHWNAPEAEQRAAALQSAGYTVEFGPLTPQLSRAMRDDPPVAVVVDFSRRPSHGREIALAIRQRKATRNLPIVIVDGEPEQVARLKELLPDATYATWGRIRSALRDAIAHPPKVTGKPKSPLDAYSGTPLPKKLGIKPDSELALIGAPPDFEATLGALPEGARVRRQARRRPDLTLWFVTSRRQLEGDIERIGRFADFGALWILWPKKASGVVTDVSETQVRSVGLASGLVDYKICAVDATWSGLKFSRRKVP